MTTSVVGTSVRFQFTAPDANGSVITAYQVLIEHADGLFKEDQTNCNAAVFPVFSARRCDILMTVLRTLPYSLTQG
jgi:hypothetical protein